MKVTRQIAARKLQAYLKGRLETAELVAWAEQAMLEGNFAPTEAPVLRKVVPRLGVADVRAFGLEWTDCVQMLRQLGYRARIDVVAA